MSDLILDPPHSLQACLHISYGFHLFSVDKKPEVWRHMPAKREREVIDGGKKKLIPAVPRHWVKVPNMASIPRDDARQEIIEAWAQYSEWNNAYAR